MLEWHHWHRTMKGRNTKRDYIRTANQKKGFFIQESKKNLFSKWQNMYDDGSTRNWYRQIVKDSKCTIKVSKLKIRDMMKNEIRKVLSQIVQL